MLGETWEDQYRRMKRSHALVKSHASQEDTALDALYHFCYDVLHFRDWINESDLIAASTRREVLLLISVKGRKGTSWAIQACADVANAAKHFELRPRDDPPAEVIDHNPGSTFPWTFPITFGPAHFVIDIDGARHSATKVADMAVEEWDDWLTVHGLDIPE
jgi:hypothetical protein